MEVVKQNTAEAFDFFWQSSFARDHYMEPARRKVLDEVADIIAQHARGALVDVGCGPGHLLESIVDLRPELASHSLVGIDYSLVALEQSRKRLPGAQFLLADANALPLSEHQFDCVCCVETLEHLEDPQAATAELERITRKGGTILVTVPNGELDDWDGHRHFFNRDSLERMFRRSRVVRFEMMNENRGLRLLLQR
jgi:ubiquinone/menaquinone biosynthesis C-methylase UbiE